MKLLIPILFVLLLVFAIKAYYDTNAIEVKHYEIKDSSLGDVLGGLKIAHLSDLHIKQIGLKEEKLLKILEKESPDLIFITGDFISFKGPYKPALTFFDDLKPPLGTYAVLGNSEYSNENGSCILCHAKGSKSLKEKPHPVFLRNSSLPLKINGKIINIIGVDDPVDKKDDLKGMTLDEPAILLAHSPEIFEEASNAGIPFILSGHTHGGQIFLTKFLRKVFPLDAALEFLDGFFQKGKSLMYVSRGVGTSFLPFRLGIKPEITFFTFTNDTNGSVRMARMDVHPLWSITNSPPYTLFLGFSISSILETFDFVGVIRNSFASTNSRYSSVLFDFESESDLDRLNWECRKWFELSEKHATSGKYSLKATLPPGEYSGIHFQEIESDWSKGSHFKMDLYNPERDAMTFHIRIDDHKSGWEYANRFDLNFKLIPGMNSISIPTNSIRTNINHRPMNLKRIKRMMVFIPDNRQKREIHIDHIRLE